MEKIKLKKLNTQHALRNTQKGITLIALVITIIVLLILAGVAINLAVDANGLFGRANEAKTEWNNKVADEESSLQNLLEQADWLAKGWDISKVGSTVTENSEVAGVKKERTAPIPKGFTASQIPGEDTIADGLVIYEDDEDNPGPVTGEKGSTEHETAMKTRNQYVWIPVDDINSMVMCRQNKSGSVCVIEPDGEGNLMCKTHNNSTGLVGRLYTSTAMNESGATSGAGTYSTNMNFEQDNQTYNANSGYREPADLTAAETSEENSHGGDATAIGINDLKEILNMLEATTYADIQEAWQNRLKSDFTAMVKSVYTYGGFYISRYEVGAEVEGNEITKVTSKKDKKILTAATSASGNYLAGNRWYGLYNTLRIPGSTTTPNSHMIWGCQYDQVIKFIGEEAQTAHSDRQQTTLHTSGTPTQEGKEEDILNNIYDLEGNCVEWTAEAYSPSARTYRGGNYNTASNSAFYSASYRGGYNPTNALSSYCTSRASLYL